MTLKNLINRDLLTFDAICDKIRNGEHFSLARYGDGEFKAILGEQGANCDGHEYFPEMGEDLADTLRSDPDYYIGLHCTGRDNMDVRTLEWLQENDLTGREYVPNEVFHIPLRDGLMGQFWDLFKPNFGSIKSIDLMVVGPSYIRDAKHVLPRLFYDIPQKKTYLSIEKIKRDLTGILNVAVQQKHCDQLIVLISASMTAPLIVDHLYQQYGNTATFIDFGSCFDPYVGRKSRSFHKNVM